MTDTPMVLDPTSFAELMAVLGPGMLGELAQLLLHDLAALDRILARPHDFADIYQPLDSLCGAAATFGLVDLTVSSRNLLRRLGAKMDSDEAIALQVDMRRAMALAASALRSRLAAFAIPVD